MATAAGRPEEPPVYRPFALLALAATLLGGSPLGVWMLVRLHSGGVAAGQVPPAWALLHAHLQVFGFFATLIPGVASHLLPRFAGRPVVRDGRSPWLAALLGAALVLRVVGTWAGWPGLLALAAALQAAVLGGVAAWVWRSLDRPSLALTRWHLTASTGWLVLALGLEAALRWRALSEPGAAPDPAGMRAVHLMGLLGGIAGWILGVALRAGPMFVPGWSVPERVARAAPWALGLGVLVGVVGEVAAGGLHRAALVKVGEALALGAVVTVALAGGAARRGRGALPMAARGGPELRLFRMALSSAGVAALGSATAAAVAWSGVPPSLLGDTLRHLVTVGFLTSMVLAMAFRLIPVFEGVPLPWPRLRALAFWALLGGILLRSAEALADYGGEAVLPWVPLSGGLVWVALACLAANLLGAIRARGRPMTTVIGRAAGVR